ncbi:hypothetical protein D3C83_27890 [compost metagenome]
MSSFAASSSVVLKFGGIVSRIFSNSRLTESPPQVSKKRSPFSAGAVVPARSAPWQRMQAFRYTVLPRSACAAP